MRELSAVCEERERWKKVGKTRRRKKGVLRLGKTCVNDGENVPDHTPVEALRSGNDNQVARSRSGTDATTMTVW